jgi:hypothetical protein
VSLFCVVLMASLGANIIVASDLSNDAVDFAMKPGVETNESHSFGSGLVWLLFRMPSNDRETGYSRLNNKNLCLVRQVAGLLPDDRSLFLSSSIGSALRNTRKKQKRKRPFGNNVT